MLTAGISFGSRGMGTTKSEQEGEGEEREKETERERRTQFVVAFFAIVNPLEMEISHINMHCIIPSSEANCFYKLALSLKRQTNEVYGENEK